MLSADDELLRRLLFLCMREVRPIDMPKRGMRDYIVRLALRTLAGDVPQIDYRIDYGKLAGGDEAEIHALCDAIHDFAFLDVEYIPGYGEYNEDIDATHSWLRRV